MDIFLNGKMVPYDEGRVPHDDAGLQHAIGLFETMSAHHGKVFRLEQHMQRIATSAQALGLAPEIDTEALAKAVNKTLKHNKIDRARVRLTMTGGSVSMLKPASNAPEPTLMIVPTEPTAYDPAYFEQGVTVLIAPPAANPFDPTSGHKTLNYWARLRTLRQAAGVGAGEAIWLNISNHLASGAVSNIFLVKDEQLFTPYARDEEVDGALPAPVLPGITRAAIMELAAEADIPVYKRMLTVEDLLEADEVLLTNSGWHVLPVSKVEKKAIGPGEVGPITRKLRNDLLDRIEKETSAEA